MWFLFLQSYFNLRQNNFLQLAETKQYCFWPCSPFNEMKPTSNTIIGEILQINGVELTNNFLRCCACLWYCAMWLHSTLFISECIMHFTSLNILSHLASLQFTASNHECHYYSSIKCLQLGVSWRTEECGWLQHFPFVHCWSSRPAVDKNNKIHS